MNIYRGGRWAALTGLLVLVLVACGQGTAPPNSVTKVTVSPATLPLSVGGTGTLTATVTTNGTADLGVTWSSADTGVATVSGAGIVTGVAAGTTTITATSKHDTSKKGTAQVTVAGGSTGEAPFLWSVSFGSDENDRSSGVAVNSLGNVILAGYTTGDLGGTNLGEEDGFVGSYTSDGTEIWLVQFGSSEEDTVHGVVVDANDDIYVVGTTYGALEGSNGGQQDAFVRKYSADGDVLWTDQFGGGDSERGSTIAVDDDGNVYVGGSIAQSTTTTGYVRKYLQAPDGLSVTESWTTAVAGRVNGIAVSPDGSVGGVGVIRAGDRDQEAHVFMLDTDGDGVWKTELGSGLRTAPGAPRDEVPATRRPLEAWEALEGYVDSGTGVALDAAGNVFMSGWTGALPVTAGVGVEKTRPFVAKLTRDGAEEWAVLLDADYHATAGSITLDPDGDLVVTGSTLVVFGRTPTPPGTELLVWKLTPMGNVVWKDVFGTSGWDSQTDVAAAADGSVYTTGHLYGELGQDNPDGTDAYLRKYGP